MKVYIANIWTAQGKWTFDAVLPNGKKISGKKVIELDDMMSELRETLQPYLKEETTEVPPLG